MYPASKRPLPSPSTQSRLTKPFSSPLIKRQVPAKQKVIDTRASKLNHASQTTTETNDAAASEDTPIDELYKQYTDLSRQLTQLRQSLDTTQQALNILKTNQQQSIQSLTEKWTSVIHDTAEELYTDAKARVERDGGFLARPRRRSPMFDLDQERHASLTSEEKALLEQQQEEDRAQALKYGLIESIEDRNADDNAVGGTVSLLLRLTLWNVSRKL